MVPKKSGNKRPYKKEQVFNVREAEVADKMYADGFVVLKRGWPDLFCYQPETGEVRLIEVKSANLYKKKVSANGKVREAWGLTPDQLRMHQYLRKIGLPVEIIWVP